jgi:hypothetical protein
VVGETLTELESEVLTLLLSREEPGYDALRAQLKACSVRGREYSGAGFFTNLDVEEGAPGVDVEVVGNPVGQGHAYPDDVFAEIDGLQWGAMFLLWLENGRISQLEGTSFAGDNPWPDPVQGFRVRWEPINRTTA